MNLSIIEMVDELKEEYGVKENLEITQEQVNNQIMLLVTDSHFTLNKTPEETKA